MQHTSFPKTPAYETLQSILSKGYRNGPLKLGNFTVYKFF